MEAFILNAFIRTNKDNLKISQFKSRDTQLLNLGINTPLLIAYPIK